jgi:site-specific recombinase XerD
MPTVIFPFLEQNDLNNDTVQWRQAVFDWLGNINSRQTRRAYTQAWHDFITVMNLAHPLEITHSHIIAYKEYLTTQLSPRTSRPYSQATINLRLSAISSFFEHAKRVGLVEANPAEDIKRKPVNPYGKATHLDVQKGEHRRFLQQIDTDTLQGKRDYAIMLIFLTTGVRVSVVANAYVGGIEQRGSEWVLVYTQKGGESDAARTTAIMPIILDYLATRGISLDNRDRPLFVATARGRRVMGHTGHEVEQEKPLTDVSINNLVRKYAHKAGLDGITAHSLRHTAAMHATQKGTIVEVSKLLRHKSIRVTTIYLEHLDIEGADRLTNELADDLLSVRSRCR